MSEQQHQTTPGVIMKIGHLTTPPKETVLWKARDMTHKPKASVLVVAPVCQAKAIHPDSVVSHPETGQKLSPSYH